MKLIWLICSWRPCMLNPTLSRNFPGHFAVVIVIVRGNLDGPHATAYSMSRKNIPLQQCNIETFFTTLVRQMGKSNIWSISSIPLAVKAIKKNQELFMLYSIWFLLLKHWYFIQGLQFVSSLIVMGYPFN